MLPKVSKVQMLAAATVFFPSAASAMTLAQFFGFLNIFVGVFLTLTFILYGAAVIVYFTRYGTPHRADSLALIEFGLTILLILIVLLGIVQYLERHPTNMAYIIGTIVFVLVVGLIVYAYSGGKKEDGPVRR